MMEAVIIQVKCIAVFIILEAIIGNIFCGSEFKKYIRLITGLILISIILKPIVTFLNGENDFLGNLSLYNSQIATREYFDNIRMFESADSDMMVKKYKEAAKSIIDNIMEKNGLILDTWDIELEENKESDAYGEIRLVRINAYTAEKQDIKDISVDEEGNIRNKSFVLKENIIKDEAARSLGIENDRVKVSISM